MGGEGRVEPVVRLRSRLASAPLAPQVFFAFEKLDTLERPLGVMSAGRWHTREQINATLRENRKAIQAQMREINLAAGPP